MQISLCIESPPLRKNRIRGLSPIFFWGKVEGGGGGVCIQAKTGVVAIAERFKQESMYKLSAGAKKAAVVESWPLWRDGR